MQAVPLSHCYSFEISEFNKTVMMLICHTFIYHLLYLPCVFQDAWRQRGPPPSYLWGSDKRGGGVLSVRPSSSIWGCRRNLQHRQSGTDHSVLTVTQSLQCFWGLNEHFLITLGFFHVCPIYRNLSVDLILLLPSAFRIIAYRPLVSVNFSQYENEFAETNPSKWIFRRLYVCYVMVTW